MPHIQRPGFAFLALLVLALMVALFLLGESLPTHIIPPSVAIIGASAGIVGVGICGQEGERVSFMRFVRDGLPITLVQLTLGAIYVFALSAFSV